MERSSGEWGVGSREWGVGSELSVAWGWGDAIFGG